MPLTAWITLLGIIVAAAVALSIAYLQRKQMRQIELHRRDPSIPLVPPPHHITQFLKSNFWYFYSIVFAVFDIWVLIRDLSRPDPVTRIVVFYICLDMVSFALMLVFVTVFAIFKTSLRGLDRTGDILRMMTEAIQRLEERGNDPPKAK